MYLSDIQHTSSNPSIHELENMKRSKYSALFRSETISTEASNLDLEISSPFGEIATKPYWYGTDLIRATPTPDGTSGTSYRIPHGQNKTDGHDLLLRSFFSFNLPQITIKDHKIGKFRIAWTEDIGIHVPVSGMLIAGTVGFSTITSYYNKARSRYNITSDEREGFEYDIGNRPELINWSTHLLPAAKIRSPQPWFYSRHYPDTAFPLFKLNESNELIHKFQFNRSILQLLRIEENVNDFWVPVEVKVDNLDFYKSILNGPPDNNFMLEYPEMHCEVSSLTLAQKGDVYINKIISVGFNPDIFYYRDTASVISSKSCKFGSSCELEVTYPTDCLIRNFYILVQNATAVMQKNYSNFTTNVENESLGVGPLDTISYKIGNVVKLHPTDADILAFTLASNKFPTTTKKHGIYPYSVACKSNSDGIDVGSPTTVTHTWILKFKNSPSSSVDDTRFIVSCHAELFKQGRFSNGNIIF